MPAVEQGDIAESKDSTALPASKLLNCATVAKLYSFANPKGVDS